MLHQRFEAGAVGYGRIDYSMLGDALVAWEVNTNPTIIWVWSEVHPRVIAQAEVFSAAFDTIEADGFDPAPISLGDVRSELRVASRVGHESNVWTLLRFGRKHRRLLKPALWIAETESIPFERRILDRGRYLNGI